VRRFVATLLFASGCLSTPDPAPSPCAVGFGGDGHDDTHVASGTGRLILDTDDEHGTYDSPIADAGQARAWSLSWTTAVPSLKQLPDSGAADLDYERGVDMAGNVLLYHLDEPVGAVDFDDSSGGGLDATCGVACATAGTEGLFGEAVTTLGNNHHLERPTDELIEPPEITIEVWALRLGAGDGMAGALVTRGFNSGEPYSSYSVEQAEAGAPQALGVLRCYFGNTGGGVTVASSMAAADSAFFHVVCTYDGTDARIFLNGVEGDSSPAPPIEYGSQAVHDLTIGTFGTDSQSFNGLIDEVAIYDHALSADEIEARWERGAQRVRLQVRSCDDPTCSDQEFVGPDGTADSYYTERCNRELGPPRELPTSDLDCDRDADGNEDDGADQAVPARRYAQYRLYLDAVGVTQTPQILDAQLCAVTPRSRRQHVDAERVLRILIDADQHDLGAVAIERRRLALGGPHRAGPGPPLPQHEVARRRRHSHLLGQLLGRLGVLHAVHQMRVVVVTHERVRAPRHRARARLVPLAPGLGGVTLRLELIGEHALERADPLDLDPEALTAARRQPLAADPQAPRRAVRRAEDDEEALDAGVLDEHVGRLHSRPVEERDVTALDDVDHPPVYSAGGAPARGLATAEDRRRAAGAGRRALAGTTVDLGGVADVAAGAARGPARAVAAVEIDVGARFATAARERARVRVGTVDLRLLAGLRAVAHDVARVAGRARDRHGIARAVTRALDAADAGVAAAGARSGTRLRTGRRWIGGAARRGVEDRRRRAVAAVRRRVRAARGGVTVAAAEDPAGIEGAAARDAQQQGDAGEPHAPRISNAHATSRTRGSANLRGAVRRGCARLVRSRHPRCARNRSSLLAWCAYATGQVGAHGFGV
jgi:hypothetical protein